MAVVNVVPELLSVYSADRVKEAAVSWAEQNSAWLKKVLDQHSSFLTESEVDKYQAAYDGELEAIENRDKSRGDDINHKLQVDMAQLIIDTVVDYMTGKPITWTIEPGEDEQGQKQVADEYRKEILELLRTENAQRVLAEQLRQGSIACYSGVICWVDEDGNIDYDEFPVQELIPVYDSRGKLRLVIRKYLVIDETEENPTERTKLEVYDSRYVTYLLQDEEGQNFQLDPNEEVTGNPVKHHAGRIPVSIFKNGTPAKYEERKKRAGTSDLKVVFSLLENLAGAMSDKANTVDRLLDQFLLFKNVTTTEEEVVKMRKARAIVLKNKESDASFLAPGQEDGAVENHLNRLENKIHLTTNTPKINELSGATATEIKMKYAGLDIKAGKKENYFSQAIKEFIAVLTDLLNARRILEKNPEADIYAILKGEEQTSVQLYDPDWLQFTINRNLPQNFLEIAQIVSTLSGTVPDSYLYELLWFIEDPVAALEEMKKQKEEASKRSAAAGLTALGFGGEFGSTGAEDKNNDEEGGGGSEEA
ncbi:phage portal protein [Cytobacillus praedii]|uniref:phage portal protein n=1 Tax=Cytobacillus praedii TaxID=1742358 RepID=UPI002E2104D8|nr:phage portal protein [Cytobacillus praedii]